MDKVINMETKMNISTEELFVLFQDIRRLFPNTSLEDFEEIIEQDGYWDTRTRTNIQTESINNLKGMWFGKGLSKVKELWHLFKSNQIGQIIDKEIIKLSKQYRRNK